MKKPKSDFVQWWRKLIQNLTHTPSYVKNIVIFFSRREKVVFDVNYSRFKILHLKLARMKKKLKRKNRQIAIIIISLFAIKVGQFKFTLVPRTEISCLNKHSYTAWHIKFNWIQDWDMYVRHYCGYLLDIWNKKRSGLMLINK